MASDLRACPFCGGSAEIFHISDGENAGGSCVSCTRCLASGNLEFGRKENFVDNWNRRYDAAARTEGHAAGMAEATALIVAWLRSDGDVARLWRSMDWPAGAKAWLTDKIEAGAHLPGGD